MINERDSSFLPLEPKPEKCDTTRSTVIEDPALSLPSTSAASDREQKMLKAISPKTQGNGVKSPFKNHLFWPGTPEIKINKRNTVKLPCVLSSEEYLEYEEKRSADKKKLEQEKEERKRKREEAKKLKECKKKKNAKGQVNDEEEDWKCKTCGTRYSSELIRSKRRRWVECDQCKGQFHYKCIPTSHLDLYGLDEEDEDDDEVAFLCHHCVDDKSDDDLANLLNDSDDDV